MNRKKHASRRNPQAKQQEGLSGKVIHNDVSTLQLDILPIHKTTRPLQRATVLRMQRQLGNTATTQALRRRNDLRAKSKFVISGQRGGSIIQMQVDMVTTTELQGKVNTLKGLAANLEKAGATLMGKSDVNLVIAGSNLLTAAKDIVDVAKIYDDFTGDLQDLAPEEISKRIGKADKALKALNLVTKLVDNDAYKAFIQDPTSKQNADKFINDVGDTFKAAGELVPPDIPFVSSMLKGYLSAPANYLKAFNSALYDYTNKIDAMSNMPKSNQRLTHGNQTLWRGELSRVAQRVYAYQGPMRELMIRHRKFLEALSKDAGVAYLMSLVGRSFSGQERQRWLNFLSEQL